MTEIDLESNFRTRFKSKLVKGSRGYGFWSWKPQVVLQTLNKMKEGDVLLYCDVGCHLTDQGLDRLDELFKKTASNESGILGFELGKTVNSSFNMEHSNAFLERNWTKADVFQHFNLLNDVEFQTRNQTMATIFFMRKCEGTVAMTTYFIEMIANNFDLITDKESAIPNFHGFIEHRHDQSLFSLLFYKNKADIFPDILVYPSLIDPPSSRKFPIEARRDLRCTFFRRKYRQICRQILKVTTSLRLRSQHSKDPGTP